MLRGLLYRPEGLLVTTFAALVLTGTIVLRLSVCQTADQIGLLDTLFTATSAVCVTGLITHDTATEFSRAGQVVILILIQLGGLGVMTFGALAFQLLHKQVSFQSQAAVQGLLFQGEFRGKLRTALRRIVLITISLEALGVLLLYAGLTDSADPQGGLFEAVFLAISGFCNAGFSVYSDSAVRLRDSQLIMWTLMALIVAGGLGYTVLFEMLERGWRRLRRRRGSPVNWSLNSRIAILASAALIGVGTLGLLLTGLTPREQTFGGCVLNALFQSVTTRTAGFNTVDTAMLSVPALMVLIPLMFIGGSPGSCAGGIKTTSLCVWLARIRARIAGREDIVLAHRRVPHDIVRRAALILALAALWNLAGITFLTLTENVGDEVRLEQIIFEQVSAFGTVGLSTGITPGLSVLGKLWIIASMFAGRLGPLTVALAVVRKPAATRFAYPEERVMIG
ncbi:MAG: ATPase [Planctomycetes bacterium]|nr:ATPase [Planctomycetota bacterium]